MLDFKMKFNLSNVVQAITKNVSLNFVTIVNRRHSVHKKSLTYLFSNCLFFRKTQIKKRTDIVI